MLQALEWESQYSSTTPPANEHPLPLTRSGSSKSLSDKAKAPGSVIMENGAEPGEQHQGAAGGNSRRHAWRGSSIC